MSNGNFKISKISASEIGLSIRRQFLACAYEFLTTVTVRCGPWCTKGCDWAIFQCIFIYLGFYVTFNTIQVISRRVVGRAEETSTYSSLGLCTVNYRPTASNYQLSHLRPSWGSNPGLRGGRRECYHSATVAPHLSV